MKRLTETEKLTYVATGGQRCPHCDSGSLESEMVDADGPAARSPVKCNSCYREWVDLWSLTGIDDSVDRGKPHDLD